MLELKKPFSILIHLWLWLLFYRFRLRHNSLEFGYSLFSELFFFLDTLLLFLSHLEFVLLKFFLRDDRLPRKFFRLFLKT